MEMEFMAEFTEGISRDRARQIIKGKRTKRHRPSSPFAVSNSSGDGDCFIDNFTPVISSEISSEEDEDMANCLIMLAQSASVSVSPVTEEEKSKSVLKSDQIQSKSNSKSDQIRQKTEKLSSRRLSVSVSDSISKYKSGYDVYECKTCNRTFQSFQALGGHRASHKKPKVNGNVEEKKSSSGNIPPEYVEEEHHDLQREDDENKANIKTITDNVQTTGVFNNNTKAKVHECSICGSEFLSGQALGGHMRKHRPIPVTGNRTGVSTNNDDSTTDEIIHKSPAGSSGSGSGSGLLSLDLNFPPPEAVEDHHRSKFQFTSGSSQPHLVFTAPAVVHCHY